MLPYRNTLVALLSCVLAATSAHAAAGLDLCNDLLQQDLFNRTNGASQASESERQAYLESFFQSDVNSAYEEYKKARAEQHNSATSVHAEGHYGIIGGEFDLSTEHGGAMSMEDFSKQFNERKSVRQSQSSGSSSRASSLISSYQSAVRDPASVDAWRQCMLSRTSEPSIAAYGFRDSGGNPYLTVMWLPGRALSSIAPQVDVRFVSPDPDVFVEGGAQSTTLASGSGKAFALRFKTADSVAKFRGFAILVNATAHDGSRHLMDFQEQATVPGAIGEVPCELLIQPGRTYGLQLYMPAIFEPDAAAANTMLALQVNDLIPAGAGAAREFNAQVTYPPEIAQKLLALSHNSPKTIERVNHVMKASVAIDGPILKFRMEQSRAQPGVLGDAGVARCTASSAEGSLPTPQVSMRFRIVAKR